ncbi:uncharacterized protein DS421_11g336270 [Arachis hypogaea]|nr:uncharacterized protein DS421_11g336270 [Arachis hypogaea]
MSSPSAGNELICRLLTRSRHYPATSVWIRLSYWLYPCVQEITPLPPQGPLHAGNNTSATAGMYADTPSVYRK